MELRQIRYFVAIAELEHFGRAAARLNIAQPALSRQMKLLEAELGFDLFERLPRGVRLTEAGRIFLDEMRQMERLLQQGIARARSGARGAFGVLRLSMIEPVAWHGLIPDSLRKYRAKFPEVEISLSTMPTEQQLARLRQRDTDAALVYNPHAYKISDLTAIELARQPMVLAMPVDCPLATKDKIFIRDLVDYKLIGFPRSASPMLYDDLQSALSHVEFSPNYVSEPAHETEILALVSAGAGLAFANSSQIWRKPHGIRFSPVEDLNVTMSLQIVHRPEDVSPTLSEFLSILTA